MKGNVEVVTKQRKTMETSGNLEELVSRLNQLRGLFAVLIVIGHCSGHFEREWLPFYLIHKFNMACVCFFFFISGLSMTCSFYRKQDYLNHFIRNKIVFLFVVAFFSRVVGMILKTLFGMSHSWDVSLIIDWNWYINEMLFFYAAFYVTFRYIRPVHPREIFLIVLTVGVFFMTIYFLRHGTWSGWKKEYFISCFSFVYGILLGEHYECIKNKFLRHKILYCGVLFLFALCCCYSINLPDDSVGGGILKNLIGICTVSIVAIVCYWICLGNVPCVGKAILFLTRVSTEIYLYQFCILDIYDELWNRWGLKIGISYILAVMISVIVLANIMHGADAWIGKRIKK